MSMLTQTCAVTLNLVPLEKDVEGIPGVATQNTPAKYPFIQSKKSIGKTTGVTKRGVVLLTCTTVTKPYGIFSWINKITVYLVTK